MFCKHKWSKWSEALECDATWRKDQFRVCETCGIIKRRTFLNAIGVMASAINEAITKLKGE